MRRRHQLEVPWPGVLIGSLLLSAAAAAIIAAALRSDSLKRYALLLLGALFIALTLAILIRCALFHPWMELHDTEIIFTKGYRASQITRIPFTEILRLTESARQNRAALTIHSANEQFAFDESQLGSFDTYKQLRNDLFTKANIDAPPLTSRPPNDTFEEFPKPLLNWTEPEDWPAYRTSLIRAQPRLRLLLTELWFLARCLAVILGLYLVFNAFQIHRKEFLPFSILAIAVSLFFTAVHWLYKIWPVVAMHITLRSAALTLTRPSKQTWDYKWSDFETYRLIERTFQNRPLRILLLKHKQTTIPIAFPDKSTQDQTLTLLRAKNIPESETLPIPWQEPSVLQ